MKFEEFLQNVVNTTETPLDLKFKPAIFWFHIDRLPVRVTSLGSSHSPIIRLPSLVIACEGNIVSVLSLAYGLFTNRTDITDIILPNKLGRISEDAFSDCTNLKRITIPRSVYLIKEKAFNGCNLLEDIYYEGTEEDWEHIHIVHEQLREKEPHKLGLYCELESVPIIGNEALFRAKVHFNCSIPDNEPRQLIRESAMSCIYVYKLFSEANLL